MPTDLIQVPFQGAAVACALVDGVPYVAMRPLCDALEVTWPRQRRAIKNDPVLASTVAEMATVGADGKTRSMLCLPLDYLNGWLFRLDAGRYKPGDPRRDRIIAYQRECYRVLRDRFMPQARPLPPCRPWESAIQAGQAEKLVGRLRRIARNRRLGKAAMHAAVELALFGEPEHAGNPLSRYLQNRLPETEAPQAKGALPC